MTGRLERVSTSVHAYINRLKKVYVTKNIPQSIMQTKVGFNSWTGSECMISMLLSIQVAYHGVPEKAYEVFVNALQSTFLSQGVDIPPVEDHNPAGMYITCASVHTMTSLNPQM